MSEAHARSGILRAGRVIVLVIYAILMAYVIILTIAFFLQLFGASPTASFVDWIYTATARIMQPFRGMFPVQQVSGKAVFNGSLLFAIIIYYLVALLAHALVDWLSYRIYSISQQREAAVQGPQPTNWGPAPSGFGSPTYGSMPPQGGPPQSGPVQGAPVQGGSAQGPVGAPPQRP